MSDQRWLDALLDGEAPPAGTVAPSAALEKLARLQRAFADLQWAELEAPAAHTPVLFKWGHLAVLASIGVGGFGEVYRAFDPMLQREVALKLRRTGNQFAPVAGRAFIEEARRLAQVRHPHVLAVHGAAVHDGRAGIWTDLITGETLAAQIERDGVLSADALLQLASVMSGALTAVHAQAMVHGDVTPLNVMREAGTQRFVLMDFGGGASLDDSGTVRLGAGSLHFMAPEQLGTERLGTAADLYSLGATLCYAATRRTPDAASALQRLHARCDLSSGFIQLLGAMVDPVPDVRPTSANAFAQCQQLITAPERAKRRRLRRALAGMLLFAVLASTTGLVFTLRAQQRAVQEAERSSAALGFVADWFKVADPNLNNGQQLTAHSMFEHGAQRLQTELVGQPAVRARMAQIIGSGFLSLGESGDALPHFEQAIALLRNDPGTEPLVLAAALERGAFAAESSSRMQQALAWLAEVDKLAAADTAQTVDLRVQVLADRWLIARGDGEWTAALALADQSLRLSERYDQGGVGERSTRALIRVGNSLKDVGRLTESLQAMERARDWYAGRYGATDMRTVTADEAVGWVMIDLGRLDEAEQKLEFAAVQVRASMGENTRRYANNLYDRALLYNARNELPRARDAFVEVARIHSETYAPNVVAQGWCLYQAAGIDWRLQNLSPALKMMIAVDQLWDGPMSATSPIRAELWGDIGELHLLLGRTQPAADYTARAANVLRAQSAGHESALAEVLSVQAEVAISLGHEDQARTLIAEAVDFAQRKPSPSADDKSSLATYQRRQQELAAMGR